jgi:hypothetical protein
LRVALKPLTHAWETDSPSYQVAVWESARLSNRSANSHCPTAAAAAIDRVSPASAWKRPVDEDEDEDEFAVLWRETRL